MVADNPNLPIPPRQAGRGAPGVAGELGCGPISHRELLELAALAAGLEGYEYDCRMRGDPLSKRIVDDSGRFLRYDLWNPARDDGDALRLAVRLPTINLQWVIAEAWQAHDNDDERRAYVREAITRAAAEVGSAMLAGGGA